MKHTTFTQNQNPFTNLLRWGLVLGLLVAGLGFQSVPVAQAAVIAVNSVLDNATAGNGSCTLREAINNANANADTTGGDCAAGSGADTITLISGTYALITFGNDDNNATGDLDILAAGGDLTINGAGAGSTIINGPVVGIDRVFHIDPAGEGGITVNISGLTIQNGYIDGYGGGIYNNGDNIVNIANSSISANTASYGGGIYNDDGEVHISDSTLSSNFAQETTSSAGGGIYSYFGVVTLTNSAISGNHAQADSGYIARGGGIYLYQGVVSLTDSTIHNNWVYITEGVGSYAIGGGINISYGTMNITNSTISENRTTGSIGGNFDGRGGGIYATSSQVNLSDGSLLQDNYAKDYGGGIYSSGGDLSLTESAIAGNTSDGKGGGIFSDNGGVTLNSSTISANTSDDNGGGIYSDGEDGTTILTVNQSTISDNTATEGNGGGIFLYYGPATLTNSTISGNDAIDGGGIGTLSDYGRVINLVHGTLANNTAENKGGGMYLEATFTVNISNTIVAKNSADVDGDDIYGHINSQDYNLIQDTSGVTIGGVGTHNLIGIDPLLGLLSNNGGGTPTRALAANSPAVDKIPTGVNGCGNAPLDVDQRSESRPQGVGCDIGAFENLSAQLDIFKSVDPETNVPYHGAVTYIIQLSNEGELNAEDVSLTDTLPANVDFSHWVFQPLGAEVANDVITWQGTIGLMEGAIIYFEFVATHTGGYGDVVRNTAQFTFPGGSGSDTATFSVEGYHIYLPLVSRNP